MKCEVGIRGAAAAEAALPVASDSDASTGPSECGDIAAQSGSTSEDYIEQHKVAPLLQDLLQEVLKEKPEDPVLFMARRMLSSYLPAQDLDRLMERALLSKRAAKAPAPRGADAPLGLHIDRLPSNIKAMHYAVRGEVDQMAQEIAKRLKQEGHGYSFDEIVPCHIGNPQAVGQVPLSYHRQLLSLLTNPGLQASALYPGDVHARAREYAGAMKVGAYTHTQGAPLLRQKVADFVTRRDGTGLPAADPDSIFLTAGASSAVTQLLPLLVSGPDDGVLIPVPQYPIYSALLTLNGGAAVGYYLDENAGWAISMEEVARAAGEFQRERPEGRLKAMVVINPGNPTGNVMTRSDMEDTLLFCHERGVVLIADEVYQHNLWSDQKRWQSFRAVALEMGIPVQIVSLHSISKGFYGECGLRGGFMQLHNIDQEVRGQFYKIACMMICPNTVGQGMMASIMNPPTPGEASYETYEEESRSVLESMRRRSKMLSERLASLPGMTCNPIEGAMYAFPRLDLPKAAILAAEAEGKPPDTFYCLELLKATGIATVPGSGFKQKPGSWHFRMTFLPAEDKLPAILDRLEAFHNAFMRKYSTEGN